MKPVDQTDITFVTGNCMQACVASILELPLGDVPNFMGNGISRFEENLNNWCASVGLIYQDLIFRDEELEAKYHNCYFIATGKSPRNPDKYHAVVWLNGELAHDPHPDKSGLIGEPEIYGVFCLKNPSRWFELLKETA